MAFRRRVSPPAKCGLNVERDFTKQLLGGLGITVHGKRRKKILSSPCAEAIMRRSICTVLFLPALLILCVAQVKAEAPPADPLRLVPKEADVFGRIDHPRQAAEALLSLEPVKKLTALKAVREYYDS